MSKNAAELDPGITPEYSLHKIHLEGVGDRETNEGDVFYKSIGGTAIFVVGGQKHPLSKDEIVFVPRGTPYQSMSSKGADLLVCTIPPSN